ncbi:hypothetical protein TMatcc_006193 [Talaromyces marneffei ATCC 18224]|uniref:DSBA-like thioredoxin domain protein n=1 Tax=Talaromyces marneffei (strain ATCC 18224 / CBS 334.59 / QM 7333) TaxID=441960 RepID=B6QC83_TALMQ|nr:uncharacterized protein EYB26_002847 [Talaromyces marneffei]EEA25577.1 DSBA-like thioredoxin domain protein [Talaromyces marneffei ATCC 18224]KAE8554296.1 hypothetical protein EYB25_002834 [Talaromyces marneffei]QGA15191.1 hypothetical protein EYB26_002847 [Talaromyces marneffei]
MVTFNIEVISDPICSWCFIAHRALERTIRLYRTTIPNGSADIFNVTYLPYYLLDPTLPSRDKTDLQGVITPRKHQNITYTRITQIGRSYGILFNFLDGKIGGTREVHRLIQLAQSRKSSEIRDRVLDNVSGAFHERAMDITDRGILRSIAIDAGVDTVEADEWMDKDKDVGSKELQIQLERARDLIGTNKGVPVVIVQGKYRFDGAPDVSELLGTLAGIRDGRLPEEKDKMQEHTSCNAC